MTPTPRRKGLELDDLARTFGRRLVVSMAEYDAEKEQQREEAEDEEQLEELAEILAGKRDD